METTHYRVLSFLLFFSHWLLQNAIKVGTLWKDRAVMGRGGGGSGQQDYYLSHMAEWLAPFSEHKGVVTAELKSGPILRKVAISNDWSVLALHCIYTAEMD